MEAEIVSTNLLSMNDFSQLIASASFLQGAFLFLEKLPQKVITTEERRELLLCDYFDASLLTAEKNLLLLAEYTSGRIFQPAFELRWEKQKQQMRVVYVGEKRDIPPLDIKEDIHLEKKGSPRSYYLFGERLRSKDVKRIGVPAKEGDYAELRIPRLLHYPVKEEKRYVQLFIQEYKHGQTAKVPLFRFVNIKAVGEMEK